MTRQSLIRQDLLVALGQIQNHPSLQAIDIMTFTALMDDSEVRKHIEYYMSRIARWSETAHRRYRRK